MSNIFNRADNAQLQQRISNLTATSQPLWGTMTASQMVVHCQKPLDVAEGNLLMKRNIIGFLFGKMARKSFLKKDEFTKNLPTAPQFKITDAPDFENESKILLATVVRFAEVGPAVIHNYTHPFFGTMNEEEWGILQYKHLDHHLKQFNV